MSNSTRKTTVTLPELFMIASTRVMIGGGLGLLLGDRLRPDARKAVGRTLLTIGALSTIPLAFEVFGGGRMQSPRTAREDQLRAA